MSAPHAGATAPNRIEILMIEDDPEYRRMVERWLARSTEPRFAVRFSTRLDDAWHRIGASDLIVLDLGLPDAAGMDTLVAVRDLAPDLPIVVLTGSDDDDIGRRALRAGADAFVPKRCAEPETLRVALRRSLAARSARHAQAELRRAVPDRSASFGDRGALLSALARAQEESWVEDFWIDARHGSITVRAR